MSIPVKVSLIDHLNSFEIKWVNHYRLKNIYCKLKTYFNLLMNGRHTSDIYEFIALRFIRISNERTM